MIKLDRSLVAGCQSDLRRSALIRHLARFAQETRAPLVAEGVECEEESLALASFGIAFGQGYHFGRPRTVPSGSRSAPPWVHGADEQPPSRG